MYIHEMFKRQRPVFSLEVFPPKREAPLDTIYSTLDQLQVNLASAHLSLSEVELTELNAVSTPASRTWPYGTDGQEQRSRALTAG